MPEEPTKTPDEGTTKEPVKPPEGKPVSAEDIVKGVTGKAADSDGPQSHGDDQTDSLKKLEEQFSKRLDKAFSKFDQKLGALREEMSKGHREDLDDEGDEPSQPNPSSAEILALREELDALKGALSGQQQEQKVVGALKKVKDATADGQPGLTDDQIRKAWEFLDTDQAQMAGFGKHNFMSDAGIRALAFAAGALKAPPSGPQGQDGRGVIGAEDYAIDWNTGKIVKPKGATDADDLSGLPLSERIRLKSLRAIQEG